MTVTLEKWSRKHAHQLVFFGAFIVFATYVTREGLSEHWKSTAEAMSNARLLYTVGLVSRRLGNGLGELQRSIRDINKTTSQRFSWEVILNLDKQRAFDRCVSAGVAIEEMQLLTEALPQGHQNLKALEDLRKQKGDLEKELLDYQSKFPRLSKMTVALAEQSTLLTDHSNNLAMRTGLLESDVRKEAEIVQKRNDRYLRIASWISAGLFVLGWGLGLLGKLYGVPEAEVSSD
jgi:hypothetical protein